MLAPRHRVPVLRLFRYTIAAFAASALAPARAGEVLRVWVLRRRDGVVDRLGKRAQAEALPQPVNNAGEAIQICNLPYRRIAFGRPLESRDAVWKIPRPGGLQIRDTAD